MPVQLLTGMESPEIAQRTATLIFENTQDAELVVLPGLGHMAPIHAPDWVNPRIRQHIARVERSAEPVFLACDLRRLKSTTRTTVIRLMPASQRCRRKEKDMPSETLVDPLRVLAGLFPKKQSKEIEMNMTVLNQPAPLEPSGA